MGLFGGLGRRRAVARAGELRRAGDPAAAIDVLAPLLVEDPEDEAANVEMARALRGLGDAAGAEEHYRRAIATRLDYELVVELAGAVAEQRRGEEAEQLVDAALAMAEEDRRLDPGGALLVRAALAAADGRSEDARAVIEAIERDARARASTKEYARRLRDRLA